MASTGLPMWTRAAAAITKLSVSAPLQIIALTPQRITLALLFLVVALLFVLFFSLSIFILQFLIRVIPKANMGSDEEDKQAKLRRRQRRQQQGVIYNYNGTQVFRLANATAGAPDHLNAGAYGDNYYPWQQHQQNGQSNSPKSDLDSIGAAMSPNLIGAFGAFGSSLFDVALVAGGVILNWLSFFLPVIIFFGVTGGITYVVAQNNDVVVSSLHSANTAVIVPILSYIIFPILQFFLGLFTGGYGLWVTITRLIRLLFYTPVKTAFVCAVNILPNIFVSVGQILYTAAYAVFFYFQQNPLKVNLPIHDVVQEVTNLISFIWVNVSSCTCNALNYIVGGLLTCINDPSLASATDNLVNAAYNLPMDLILRPIFFLQRPSVNNSFELTVSGLTSFGQWVENVTVCQFDFWLYGGNGTLIGMVNGTLPEPTDDLIYLIRFLRADYAQMILIGLHVIPTVIIWQPLYIIFRVDQVFSSYGAQVFNFDWIRNQLIVALGCLGTLINILPMCNNLPDFVNLPFGELVSIGRAIVWLAQIIMDILVGEVYSTFNTPSKPLLYFTGMYLQGNSHLQEFQWQVALLANATGCALAYIDQSIGVSFAGLAQAVIIYVPLIPAQFISFLRVVIEEGNPTIFDSISVEPFESALLQTAKLGQFFFQFQPGANAAVCAQGITFFCSLGLVLQHASSAFFLAITIALRLLIWLIKVIVGLFTTNNQNEASLGVPDFNPLRSELYGAGCRAGMTLALIIPIDVPCMQSKPGFCKIKEFPGQLDSTFSICLATTMCKVGNLIAVLPDLLFIALSYITSRNPLSSPLIFAIRQVFDVIIFRILSPICPLAHFFDCMFDVIFQTGNSQESTPATSFFCLITGAMVYIVDTLGEIVLKWVDFILTIIIGLLNGITGDFGSWLVEVLKKFFEIVGASFEAILSAIFNLILGIFMGLVVVVCWAVNVFIFFSITDKCEELEDNIAAVFGSSSAGFFSPEYVNYKRDMGIPEPNSKTSGGRKGCALSDTSSFANFFFTKIQEHAPSLFDPEALGVSFDEHPDIAEAWHAGKRIDISSMTHLSQRRREALSWQSVNFTVHHAEECRLDDKRRSTSGGNEGPSIVQRIIRKHFGQPPENPEDLPTHLATNVYWESTSTCHALMHMINGSKLSQLGPAEKVQIAECVRLKALAITMKAFTVLSWIPEDAFYNTGFRLIVFGVQFVRFALVALQWFVDRVVPIKTLLSIQYSNRWESMHLDVSHYEEFRRLAGVDQEAIIPTTAAFVSAYVSNYTLDQALHRSFPALYNNKTDYNDPILGPLYKVMRFASDYSLMMINELHNQTLRDVNASTAEKAYMNMTAQERAAMWQEFGPEVMRSIDLRAQTTGFYDLLSTLVMSFTTMAKRWWTGEGQKGGSETYDRFREVLIDIGNNIPTLSRRAANTPWAAYDRSDIIWADSQRNMQHRIKEFYNSSIFATSPSPAIGMAAAISDLYARSLGFHPNNTIPPWCIIKASQYWHISTGEARDRLTPQDCQNMTVWKVLANESTNAIHWATHLMRPRNADAIRGRNAIWNLVGEASDAIWRFNYAVFGGDVSTKGFIERSAESGANIKRDKNFYDPKRLEKVRETHFRLASLEERNEAFRRFRRENPTILTNTRTALRQRISAISLAQEQVERRQSEYHEMRLRSTIKKQLRANGQYQNDRSALFSSMHEMTSAAIQLPSFINGSFLLTQDCTNLTGALCQECYLLATFIDNVVARVTFLIEYYTGFFVDSIAELGELFLYLFDPTTPARIGRDGNMPPWFPVLGVPAGIYFQFTDAEIANGGPSLTLWLERMVNGTITNLWQGGPCITNLESYISARNAARAAQTPFRTQPGQEVLEFFQITLGINVCAVQDTITYLYQNRFEEIVEYIIDHSLTCAYYSEINCSQQDYSWSGGWVVTLVYFGPLAVLTSIVLIIFPMVSATALFFLSVGALFFHTIITYNWSAWCGLVPPQCAPLQINRFVLFSAFPKCNPLLGGFVLNSTYNNYNCYQNNLTWEFAKCSAVGFNTIFDNLAYFKLWLGGDLGISNWLAPLVASIFGSVTPSTDFAGWNTDPILHRVFGMCSLLTVIPQFCLAVIMAMVAVSVLLGLTRLIVVPIAALVLIGNIASYSAFALRDIMHELDSNETDNSDIYYDDDDDVDGDIEDELDEEEEDNVMEEDNAFGADDSEDDEGLGSL